MISQSFPMFPDISRVQEMYGREMDTAKGNGQWKKPFARARARARAYAFARGNGQWG